MAMANTQQFCTFFLKDRLFGIPVEQVHEVIQSQDITRVPLAPPVICGLINLRGQIVIAIDLRRQLAMEELPAEMSPINVVVRTQEGPVSLLVDVIGDVVEVEEQTFERPPDTLNRKMWPLIFGVHKLESRLMHVLDTEKACSSCIGTGEV